MEERWEPGVRKLFIRILNSVALGLIWMMSVAVAGIYFKLGWSAGGSLFYTLLFYTISLVSLIILLRYLYRIWK